MKRGSQHRIARSLMVSMIGGLLVAGALDGAWATEISSGLLRSSIETHCAVVNQKGSGAITVRISIFFGQDASACVSELQTIGPGEARGVLCLAPDAGTYCEVTGTFDKTKVRAKFSNRDANGEDQAILELR